MVHAVCSSGRWIECWQLKMSKPQLIKFYIQQAHFGLILHVNLRGNIWVCSIGKKLLLYYRSTKPRFITQSAPHSMRSITDLAVHDHSRFARSQISLRSRTQKPRAERPGPPGPVLQQVKLARDPTSGRTVRVPHRYGDFRNGHLGQGTQTVSPRSLRCRFDRLSDRDRRGSVLRWVKLARAPKGSTSGRYGSWIFLATADRL